MALLDVNTLNYPLFKVTPEEKHALINCKHHYSDFLCVRVRKCPSLVDKIEKSINGEHTLTSYLFGRDEYRWGLDYGYNPSYHCKLLRNIWVDKLIEFNS